MKYNLTPSFTIYLTASVACLIVMIIVDYFLREEAEFLNAWAIINKLLGIETNLEDSLIIRQLGLAGATFVMLLINATLGISFTLVYHRIVELFNS